MRDPIGTSWVGRTDCSIESVKFATEAEAESYLNDVIAKRDPAGVTAGDYFIDVERGES